MTFEEVLRDHARELIRFAVMLCGERRVAHDLVSQAVQRAVADQPVDADPDTVVPIVRAWIVRGFLSEGMRLGAPVAADVDVPRETAGPAKELTDRVQGLSKLGRAVLLLRFGQGLDVGDIARTVGSTSDGIDKYLDAMLGALGIGPAGDYREEEVRALLAPARSEAAPAPVAAATAAPATDGDASSQAPSEAPSDAAVADEASLDWHDVPHATSTKLVRWSPVADRATARRTRRRWVAIAACVAVVVVVLVLTT